MEYGIIIAMQIIGIGFNVLYVLLQLDREHLDDSFTDVLACFWRKDRITVIISLWIIPFNLIAHYLVLTYSNVLTTWEYAKYAQLTGFVIALLLGYGGQARLYKWLGKAGDFLDKRVEDRLK